MRKKNFLWVLITGLLALLVACHSYYKVVPAQSSNLTETTKSTDSLRLLNRYFILRCNGKAYSLIILKLSADRKTADCMLEVLPNNHLVYAEDGTTRNYRFKKSDPAQTAVLSEVHFYQEYDPDAKPGPYTLQLDKITKIEVIEFDKKRTTNSYVIGAVGYTFGGLALAAIIIVATKSSCPFVSAYTNSDFLLQGELYGGAIYPQLARHDYLPLKISPDANNQLRIRISNELKERQYTDMADLWVIHHPTGSRVLADENGHLFCLNQPVSPATALFSEHRDVRSELAAPGDNKLLYFDDSTKAVNQVVLKFNKPAIPQKGLLQLNLKNSYWLDYLYGELAKKFGSYYAAYVKQQKSKTAAELTQWVNDQSIPLTVSVKTQEGWQEVTRIATTGPLATRDLVIPVDCSRVTGTEVEIRLTSGFMFWEIDYAAMDFTTNHSFTVQVLSPEQAIDESGQDQLPVLLKEDGQYLDQPAIGNMATLTYKSPLPPGPGMTRSYILHSKGYYEHIREFSGKPDLAFLEQFRKTNAFPVFGLGLYKKVSHDTWNNLATSH